MKICDLYYDSATGDIMCRVHNTFHPMERQSVNIELTHTAVEILDWAREKMDEEKKFLEMRKNYPALEAAYEHLENTKRLITGSC